MANVRKKISELTALTSASLDTTLVGVDGGTTYKIELDTLADAVTARVNILDRDRLQSLESVTSSFETKGRSVISSSAQITNLGFVSTSVDITSLNSFTASQFTLNATFTNGITGRLTTSSFNDFSSSVNQRILDATNEQSFNGLISGSSQLTSSYDSRYVLSGSITQTTWDNIANKPDGIVSQSTDLSYLNSFTASQSILNTAFTNGVSARLQTSSFNEFSASVHSEIIAATNEQSFNGLISGSSQLTSSFDSRYVLESETGSLQTSITNLNTFTQSFSTSVDSRIDTLEATIISGSPNYTQVLGNQRVTSTSGTSIISGSITTSGNPVQIIVTGDANPIVTTGQWCTLQIYRDNSAIGGVVQVEAANTNENQAYCVNVIDTPSAGTYTYSLRMTANGGGNFQFGEATGPVLTAVELRTNTNLPSTNNTFTGTNRFNGQVTIGGVGGDEGGELRLVTAETNTTLTGGYVSADIYQNRLRIFEGGGDFRGVHIDLSKTPGGVAGELIWKTSGFVNAGTFLTLDNLKVSVTTGGNRGLSVGAVSTNFTANIAGWYGLVGGGSGYSANNIGYTTTASTSAFSWSFPTEGDTSQYNILDKTNSRFYRVTLMIGASYLNNFISIERLY
jgi:hypothetical protein